MTGRPSAISGAAIRIVTCLLGIAAASLTPSPSPSAAEPIDPVNLTSNRGRV